MKTNYEERSISIEPDGEFPERVRAELERVGLVDEDDLVDRVTVRPTEVTVYVLADD